MLQVKLINNQWRVIYAFNGKPATRTIFESYDDALAYIEKFDDLAGQF